MVQPGKSPNPNVVLRILSAFSKEMARKRTKENQEIDRISNLPNHVIDFILDRVTIGDAVRTSISSRKWRHHWTRVANLVFDQKFVKDEIVRTGSNRILEEMKRDMESDYIDAVGTFLLLHQGPIHKFILHVPESFDRMGVYVNKWMHYVSRSGVKEITLDVCTSASIPLDSYIFNCIDLRRLTLRNCQARLPYNFRGFDNLISIHLLHSWIPSDELGVFISKCPLLEIFSIEDYIGPLLSVSALKLKTFRATRCCFAGFEVQNVPCLGSVSFRDSVNHKMQPGDIVNFFGLMPKIESITLNSLILIVLARQHVPKTLPKPLECHINLTLLNIDVAEPKQISCALCILRSSPNLQTLSLSIFALRSPVMEEAESAAVAFLEEQLSEPIYPRNLLMVKMKGLIGTRSQIMLLRFILISCPALETLYANAEDFISEGAKLMMMSELMECNRVSSKAKIIFLKGQGSSAVSYSNGQVDNSIFDF
ncbi:hypothetical protein QQ045_020210 [Rhodiola kirilowii]